MKNYDNIANLVTGNLNLEDKKNVISEILTDPESRQEFYNLKAVWAVLSSALKRPDDKAKKSYLDLREKIHKKTFPSNLTGEI